MEHFKPPHTNTEFWSSKIEGNRLRDRETDALLEENGWAVIRIWEHEDAEAAARLVRATVLGKREMLAGKVPLLQGE
jgi:DNA mismatch endonuclease (patch repair protein)